jgi:hypothetical protein
MPFVPLELRGEGSRLGAFFVKLRELVDEFSDGDLVNKLGRHRRGEGGGRASGAV